ncbi:MAG: energy-coupling factor transporter transmembrane protein EcfT [Oscillospiraceae bacterium]|nr:energy-coupling factor transporter transmembrane protein EcfT [Oscillospiraceae bacterium]
MPEWLTKSENYTPRADRDTFLGKSIIALLGLFARVRAQDARAPRKWRVNAFFKALFTLALIVFVSLSREFAFLFTVLTYILLTLCALPARALKSVLALSLTMTAFSFVILLPAAFWGGAYSVKMIPVKVFITVSAANILSHTSRWSELISALKRFRAPDIFVFMLDITIKYIVLLGELALESLRALRLRSVGRNERKYAALSGVAGTMFLKSREMAEEAHTAMVCRGFTGEYRVAEKLRFQIADMAYIMVNAGLIFAYFYLNRG